MRILSSILFASLVCMILATTRANHLVFDSTPSSNVESSTQANQSIEHKPFKRWWSAVADLGKSLANLALGNGYGNGR